ncbi:MAG: hypothetical protein E3J87_04255 [Candidatus Cloacimonadota bacterium]|nr:MAG: hypothetical protein E3J87_04255 [Candidatus Cloacimonadota bacterium]
MFVVLQMFLFMNGCGLNPVPAPNVISGSDSLFAPKNNDAIFTFMFKGETYGSFKLEAYQTYGLLKTPHGGGIQKSLDNMNTAPESGYSPSEECGIPYIGYYYYMITDMEPHYAKVLIHAAEENQDGITINFNWWLQTQAGERNF